MARFGRVVVAGTFNCIHNGHRELLRTALEAGEGVLLGLTSDEFARRLKGEAKPYAERKAALEEALGEGRARCEIVMIEDEVATAGERGDLQAIVVSTETEPNARRVNGERKRRGLPELEIIVIPLVKDAGGRKLSCRRKSRG